MPQAAPTWSALPQLYGCPDFITLSSCLFPGYFASSSAAGPRYPTTSNRSDCGGCAHSSSAPAMATARSGLARQAS